jgi:ABC-type nickel/cobalt efflux system permease component RcnA
MEQHEYEHSHLNNCQACDEHADRMQRRADRQNRQWATEARFGIQPARTR